MRKKTIAVITSIGLHFMGNTRHEQHISTVFILLMLSFKNLQKGAIKGHWLPFNKLFSTNKPESTQLFCIVSICYIVSQINLKACSMQSTFIKRLFIQSLSLTKHVVFQYSICFSQNCPPQGFLANNLAGSLVTNMVVSY